MHIAIITPAFNAAAYLPDAIRSVLAQTHVDWSMTVVDDGSADATATMAGSFRDDRIRLIRQGHSGVSAARNAGLAAVALDGKRPGAVLFLDADDWLAPDALRHLADALVQNPVAIASVGRFVRVGTDRIPRVAARPPEGDLVESLLTRNMFANGGHLLIRYAAAVTAGDFRTGLAYGEDWEYWTRLALQGAFVAVRSAAPLLFVRQRLEGAYLSRATNPDAYRSALTQIYRNPAFAERLGTDRLASLARQAEAEIAWTVGRELVRHDCRREGLRWLLRSVRGRPSVKRLALLGMVWLGFGPYQTYQMVVSKTLQ